MKAGIDFGSSTTDLVILDKYKLVYSSSFLDNLNKIKKIKSILTKFKVKKINVTGAYSNDFKLKDYRIKKIDEIQAIGKGGLFVSGAKNALVVSIGSGTAMVSCKNGFDHIGGTAIGSKTITGLSKLILKIEDIFKINKLAQNGNITNVDLMITDIYPKGIGLLGKKSSASHFGKLKDYSNRDIAFALINMAAQVIGTLSVFGAKAYEHKKIILTGGLTNLKTFRRVIKERIEILSDIPVEIPKNAPIATAIGAALS